MLRAISYIYRLPFFAGSTDWPAAALQGWQISGTTLFQSGVAFHLHTRSDALRLRQRGRQHWGSSQYLEPIPAEKSFDNPAKPPRYWARIHAGPLARTASLTCTARISIQYSPRRTRQSRMNTFRKDGTANWNVAFGRISVCRAGSVRSTFAGEFINFFNTPSSINRECNWPWPLSERSPTPSTRAGRCSSRSS